MTKCFTREMVEWLSDPDYTVVDVENSLISNKDYQ